MISSRKAATREQLIGATESLLSEGGLAAVTTQSVARRGGFAEGTIYRHFESRDELIISTLRERFRGDFEEAVSELQESVGRGAVESNLARFLAAVIPLYPSLAPAVGMLAADPALAAKNAEALRVDCRGPRKVSEQIENYFREEQGLGRVARDIDPRAAAGLLVSVGFYHALMIHLMDEDPIGLPEHELAGALAAVLTRGVGASPQSSRVKAGSRTPSTL